MKTIFFLTLGLLLASHVLAADAVRAQNLMSHISWIDLCKNWDEKGQNCIECFEGCTRWENICVHVVKYCARWDQTGHCAQCEFGYGSSNGMSINGTCPENQNATLSQNNQTNITDQNCQCHNDYRICIDCYAGFYLDMDYFCTELPENCTAADPFGNCTECITGFTAENGTCVPEGCDLSLCVRFNEDQTKCLQCPYRSYLKDGCCWQVNGYCQKWVPETGVCLNCYVGYKINKNDNKQCILYYPQ